MMSATLNTTTEVADCPPPFTPMICGVAEVKTMLPVAAGLMIISTMLEYDPTVAVMVTVPEVVVDALNVALASPDTVVEVAVMVPKLLSFIDHATDVPSGALALALSMTVALSEAVPPRLRVEGVDVTVTV